MRQKLIPSLVLVLCAVFIISATPLRIMADESSIETKLNKAKVDYDTALEKYRSVVVEWIEKREEAARKVGDKKAVDQIKSERLVFDAKGELPKGAPNNLKTQLSSARSAMDQAYKSAVAEYTKAKRDDEAAAVEKAWTEFRGVGQAGPTNTERAIMGLAWSTPKGQVEFNQGGVLVVNGKKAGTWAVVGTSRVMTVLDEGQFYDLYVFNKDFTSFEAYYIGQPRNEVGYVGKAVRNK